MDLEISTSIQHQFSKFLTIYFESHYAICPPFIQHSIFNIFSTFQWQTESCEYFSLCTDAWDFSIGFEIVRRSSLKFTIDLNSFFFLLSLLWLFSFFFSFTVEMSFPSHVLQAFRKGVKESNALNTGTSHHHSWNGDCFFVVCVIVFDWVANNYTISFREENNRPSSTMNDFNKTHIHKHTHVDCWCWTISSTWRARNMRIIFNSNLPHLTPTCFFWIGKKRRKWGKNGWMQLWEQITNRVSLQRQ